VLVTFMCFQETRFFTGKQNFFQEAGFITFVAVHFTARSNELDFGLMSVDPCIIVQFIMKNPTRCNNVSKLYYSIFI
jgi:hypothetical protein